MVNIISCRTCLREAGIFIYVDVYTNLSNLIGFINSQAHLGIIFEVKIFVDSDAARVNTASKNLESVNQKSFIILKPSTSIVGVI